MAKRTHGLPPRITFTPPTWAGQLVGVLTDRDAPMDASSTATGDNMAAGREATAPAESGTAYGTPYEVTASSLRLRAGLSGEAAVRGGASRGARVDMLGRQGAWLDVRLQDGARGWMHGDHLAPLAGGGMGRIYHVPGSRWHDCTRIDIRRGERWFCSEGEARAAGWRAPRG